MKANFQFFYTKEMLIKCLKSLKAYFIFNYFIRDIIRVVKGQIILGNVLS